MPITTSKEGLPGTRRCCSRCGTLGHLSTTCTRGERAYHKVGLEIEGFWRNENWSDVKRAASNWHMDGGHDGSLNVHTGFRSYEWKTRPGSLGEAINQLVALYPDATDSSCGMHVHVSFGSTFDVTLLTAEAFNAYFREQFAAWGTAMGIAENSEFWKRLRGENSYCRLPDNSAWIGNEPKYPDPDDYQLMWRCYSVRCGTESRQRGFSPSGRPRGCLGQRNADGRSCDYCYGEDSRNLDYYNEAVRDFARERTRWEEKCRPQYRPVTDAIDRYRQINFCSYSAHGTVECRLLPMFRDARLGVAAIEKLIDILETFLASAEETVLAPMSKRISVPIGPDRVPSTRHSTVDLPSEYASERSLETDLYAIPTPADGYAVLPAVSVLSHVQGVI